MAPRPKPWFRFYVETVHDPKIRRLKPEHRWLWVVVLACARASSIPGELLVSNTDPMQLCDISDAAAMQKPATQRGLTALETAGLIDRAGTVPGAWRVSKWAERQFESDTSTDRVTALRQRRSNGDATAMQRPPITESESDTESNSSPNSFTTRAGDPPDDNRFVEILKSRIVKRMHGRTIANPDAYATKITAELTADDERTRRLLAEFPDAPATVIAAHLDGEANTLTRYRRQEQTA